MPVSGVVSTPAPKIETSTKSMAKESQVAEDNKANIRAKEEKTSQANKQLSEIGTNVNIAV